MLIVYIDTIMFIDNYNTVHINVNTNNCMISFN